MLKTSHQREGETELKTSSRGGVYSISNDKGGRSHFHEREEDQEGLIKGEKDKEDLTKGKNTRKPHMTKLYV